ncbi:MAG: hypothetical protein QXG16_04760 [Candidatus Anstonellaceae archaeon]
MFNIQNQDIFSYIGKADAICITTNGYINKQGLAVMGRGCAKESIKYWNDIQKILAQKIKENGNVVNFLLQEQGTWIISFPVKPTVIKNTDINLILPHLRKIYANKEYIPGFATYADLSIIENSAKQLKELADTMGFKKIVLPLPGCGAGGLKPWKVLPILNKYFDERFIVCVKEEPYPNYVDFLKLLAENNGKLQKTMVNFLMLL